MTHICGFSFTPEMDYWCFVFFVFLSLFSSFLLLFFSTLLFQMRFDHEINFSKQKEYMNGNSLQNYYGKYLFFHKTMYWFTFGTDFHNTSGLQQFVRFLLFKSFLSAAVEHLSFLILVLHLICALTLQNFPLFIKHFDLDKVSNNSSVIA